MTDMELAGEIERQTKDRDAADIVLELDRWQQIIAALRRGHERQVHCINDPRCVEWCGGDECFVPERPPSGEMVAEFMPCEAQPNPEPKMVVPIATLDRIMRDCEHGSRIWKECDALLRAYRLAAAEAEVRKPCPLCGRTEPHSHTSGPLGMS